MKSLIYGTNMIFIRERWKVSLFCIGFLEIGSFAVPKVLLSQFLDSLGKVIKGSR